MLTEDGRKNQIKKLIPEETFNLGSQNTLAQQDIKPKRKYRKLRPKRKYIKRKSKGEA